MSTEKHFCVEQLEDGQYALHAKEAKRVSKIVDAQSKAVDPIHVLEPDNLAKDALRRKPGSSAISRKRPAGATGQKRRKPATGD